jgi:aryl-alcohol dehydrogenase-like predicted oxidoreductase/enamine deaminase RidA (YjgF/YER057c/UK114 family)
MADSSPQTLYTDLAPDLRINRVVTGLWQIADMERDDRHVDLQRAAQSMQPYVDAGLSTFDMADHYGSAEDIAGLFRTECQAGEHFRVLTKWVPRPGETSAENTRAAIERALTRLKAERIDLLQYHTWNYADLSYIDNLWHLQALKEEGLVGNIGLTNFDTAHLRLVLDSGVDIVSNQVCFSLLDQRARGQMAELCAERGVKLLAFGTLAGGFLSERWLGKPEPAMESLQTWSQMKYKRYIDAAGGWATFQNLLQVLHQVAQRHAASIANVATRCILDHPAVAAVLIGARLGESEHIGDNLRLQALQLADEDRAAIETALGSLATIPGDCGDEYRKPPFLTASGDLSHHLSAMPAPFPTRKVGDDRELAGSGTHWEALAGFSRAVRVDNRVLVSGTTATQGDRVVGGADPGSQTHFVIDKIEGALQSLGARLEDVVRTRIYVRDLDDWEPVARAHGQRFAGILPANSLVQAPLVGEEYKVEIEAEAVIRA